MPWRLPPRRFYFSASAFAISTFAANSFTPSYISHSPQVMWRTRPRVPCRDSSRHPVGAQTGCLGKASAKVPTRHAGLRAPHCCQKAYEKCGLRIPVPKYDDESDAERTKRAPSPSPARPQSPADTPPATVHRRPRSASPAPAECLRRAATPSRARTARERHPRRSPDVTS
jgi:hypothetical protein